MTRKAYAECSAHNHVSICTEKRGGSQYMKKVLLGLFFLYCLLLAEILFLSRVAVREITVAEYFRTYANVCPFKTIVRYTVHVMTRKDLASLRLAISNIGGNFVLFMPMGIFLPVLFKGLNRFRRAFFVILLLVFLIEFCQGIFRVGIPDIDDLAVNMTGACVGILLGKNFVGYGHRKSFVRIHFE